MCISYWQNLSGQLRATLLTALFCQLMSFQDVSASVPKENFLNFDGAQQYVELPYHSGLDLSLNTFTVSAWINPASWGQNNQGRIIDHGGGSSGNSGWTLQLQDSGSESRLLRFKINNDSSYDRSSNADVIELGVWQHVAVTFDNGTLTFYVDGIEQGVSTGVPVPSSRVSPLRIGMRSTDLLRAFDGDIDEVRIWNRSFTAAEIQGNMNIELTGAEPGLVAYYRFNEAQGQTTQDFTSTGNDATLGSTLNIDANDPVWIVLTNQPPVVDAGSDHIVVLSNNVAYLNGSFSDDGLSGSAVTTSWSVFSGPGNVTFSDASSLTSTASFSDAGIYQLRLTANDGEFSAFDDVVVTVDETAVATVINVQSESNKVLIGDTLSFTAEGFDQAGNPMLIVPSWSATGGTIDSQGEFTAGSMPGLYTVTASVGNADDEMVFAVIDPDDFIWPTGGWITSTAAEVGLQQTLLEQARNYALTGGGSGAIIKDGQLVLYWGDQTALYDIKSSTKSFGAAIAGLALDDGLIGLDQPAQLYLPDIGTPPQTNIDTGWLGQVTPRQLLTHTAGFDKTGGYPDLLFEPGTTWSYSDGGANWMADILTSEFNQDLRTVLFDRILTPLGLSTNDLSWRNNAYRPIEIDGVKYREFGSGISVNIDTMARFGYLFLRQGEWDGVQLLSAGFISDLSAVPTSLSGLPVNLPGEYYAASDHYGYFWWNNADGTMPNVPRDAYWAWGLFDSLIIVIPSLDIVVARAGNGLQSGWEPDYSVLEPFLEPIVLATLGETFEVAADSSAVMLDVLSNDLEIGFENETLTIISVGPTSDGGVVTNLSNSLEYTPLQGFSGVESFEYTVQSSAGTTFTVTVTVTIVVQSEVADGDLNDDGVVDIKDVLRAYQIVLGVATPDAAEIQRGDIAPMIDGELTSDGVFDLGDLLLIQRKALGELM